LNSGNWLAPGPAQSSDIVGLRQHYLRRLGYAVAPAAGHVRARHSYDVMYKRPADTASRVGNRYCETNPRSQLALEQLYRLSFLYLVLALAGC